MKKFFPLLAISFLMLGLYVSYEVFDTLTFRSYTVESGMTSITYKPFWGDKISYFAFTDRSLERITVNRNIILNTVMENLAAVTYLMGDSSTGVAYGNGYYYLVEDGFPEINPDDYPEHFALAEKYLPIARELADGHNWFRAPIWASYLISLISIIPFGFIYYLIRKVVKK